MVNGYAIPPVIYEPFNFFAATELPAAGREITASMMDANWYLAEIWEMHSVAGGASAAIKFRKITDNSAPNAAASATVIELTGVAGASTHDLTLSPRVFRKVTLISSVSARTFKPLQRLTAVTSGTLSPYADALYILKWIRVT